MRFYAVEYISEHVQRALGGRYFVFDRDAEIRCPASSRVSSATSSQVMFEIVHVFDEDAPP